MKKLHRFCIAHLTLAVIFCLLSGCQKKIYPCPFTTITWENTLDDILDLEGDSQESYDSVYGGTTYTFPKEYNELQGTVKYMFDESERLVCISWMYQCSDSGELNAVYEKLHSEAENALGKSGYEYNTAQFADAAPFNDVWYLESGNIVFNTVDTNDVKILQYTFLHPDVSEERPQKN